jgi:glycosyltransferase involved in cell wall biosynthesis
MPKTEPAFGRPDKVAIIHYWLVGMRGGERVLEELLRLYPNADIYTHVVDRSAISPLLAKANIIETSISRLPFARKHYQKYLGGMPRALEELDLSAYDLVLSSESGPAKGVIARPDATHLCYCHSPMRYIWDHYPAYRSSIGGLQRRYFSHLAHKLRIWDVTSASRVDAFVANSRFIAARINRVYGRDAAVVHPPCDLERFTFDGAGENTRDYYLFLSELVPYKRADLAVAAFAELDRPILVAGTGPEAARLADIATDNVTFLGRVPDADLAKLYRGARALIFPAEEDFGIVPVEAMACGTPVIAFARGGALDSVRDGVTGVLFEKQQSESLRDAVQKFEATRSNFDAEVIANHAKQFGAERFRTALQANIDAARSAKAARFARL